MTFDNENQSWIYYICKLNFDYCQDDFPAVILFVFLLRSLI